MILAGEIWIDDTRAEKAGVRVPENAEVAVTSRARKYASRGGIKLEGALADFSIDPAGRICLDVGASTGGFTDCLLQKGASRVYTVDVNVDQLPGNSAKTTASCASNATRANYASGTFPSRSISSSLTSRLFQPRKSWCPRSPSQDRAPTCSSSSNLNSSYLEKT